MLSLACSLLLGEFRLFRFLSGALGSWHLAAFDQVGVLLEKLLDSSAQQECVFVAFLCEQGGLLHPLPLVVHVAHDKFVLLVLKPVQLGNRLIARNIRCWEVD